MSNRAVQLILIASTLVASWLGMQAVHELGHMSAAWIAGGEVVNVALHPAGISRTDIADNPHPLTVAWAGPLFGVLAPMAAWQLAARCRCTNAFLLQFFAGFCLVANGLYLGVGSINRVGDCGDLLRHGAPAWQLWTFGVCATLLGLWLWHGQGRYFGLSQNSQPASKSAAGTALAISFVLLSLGLWVGD